jgi:hypothetical protein
MMAHEGRVLALKAQESADHAVWLAFPAKVNLNRFANIGNIKNPLASPMESGA